MGAPLATKSLRATNTSPVFSQRIDLAVAIDVNSREYYVWSREPVFQINLLHGCRGAGASRTPGRHTPTGIVCWLDTSQAVATNINPSSCSEELEAWGQLVPSSDENLAGTCLNLPNVETGNRVPLTVLAASRIRTQNDSRMHNDQLKRWHINELFHDPLRRSLPQSRRCQANGPFSVRVKTTMEVRMPSSDMMPSTFASWGRTRCTRPQGVEKVTVGNEPASARTS